MRWSEKETYEFVKLYFSHEYLWNNEHEDYKLNKRRLKAYRDILLEFDALTGIALTISEVRGKIKNLRSTYAQELNKIKFRSGPHYTYEPTIKWFSYWHQRFLRISKTPDSMSTYENPSEIDNSRRLWIADEIDNTDDHPLHSYISEHSDLTLFLKSEPEDSPLNHIDNHNPHKLKRKNKQSSSSTDISEIIFSFESNLKSDKEDEFDIYGKYIASQMRSLSLSKALRLQLEIQTLITKARLSNG